MAIKSKPKSKSHRNESPVNLDPDSSRKNRIPTGSSVDLKDAQDIQHEPTPSPEQ